jgi:phospholipid/cholesterol/gamma-HCH transport system permease protein
VTARLAVAPGRLALSGNLDAAGAGEVWQAALAAAGKAREAPLVLDVAGVAAWDTAGITLIADLETAHGDTRLEGAGEQVTALLARVREAHRPPPPAPPPPPLTWRQLFGAGITAASEGIVFLGEVTLALVYLPARLKMFRRRDLFRAADQAGVKAVPLVLLLGTLIGLILAFQSLLPMRRFGADIYVASLVAIGLVRELGPLLAAVILAGRSGSAFAAEIGTMKVNQEIDALVTMGLEPVTMLVLPRLLAAIAIMPVLTILLDLAGLLGMGIVLVGDGIPQAAIGNQIVGWVVPRDLYGALVKAAVFGAAVAAVGCRAGMGTGLGPEAVGVSATRAVVGGIVAAIMLDGVFAVVFYQLGL